MAVKPLPPPQTDRQAEQLVKAKLVASGLDQRDAALLGMLSASGVGVASLGSWCRPVPSLVIPYYDAFGDPLTDVPGGEQFFRLRYLDPPSPMGSFAASAGHGPKRLGAKRVPKYVQPPRTVSCAYLPRTVNWAELLPDGDAPLIITEGELKAACACKHGYPAIGLGGVWAFMTSRLGLTLLADLDEVAWLRRSVVIVFDADAKQNPNVIAAANELAYELSRHGAFVSFTSVPVLEGAAKAGLDDYIVAAGHQVSDAVDDLLEDAVPLGAVGKLFELNKRYVYVANPGAVVDQRTAAIHKPTAVKEHLEATQDVLISSVTKDGVRRERKAVGPLWLKWPLRRYADRLTYLPGEERFVADAELLSYNVWHGWGCEPERGSAKPFIDLIDHLFTGASEAERTWFTQWLAYPIQHPGAKLFTAAVVHGFRHGTGKSLVGHTMARVYGKNFSEIKQADLHATFNEWAMHKQFILADDITGTNNRGDADVLKKMITEEFVRINPKYVQSYEVPDCINYLFTSNQPDAFFLEDDDRRFFVHEVLVEPLSSQFYDDYADWLRNGGDRYVFYWLQHVDLAGFNPAGRAPLTVAKTMMIDDVKSDLAAWVHDLMASPDDFLRVGAVRLKADVYTSAQLLELYDPGHRTKVTANGVTRELRKAGCHYVLGGEKLVVKGHGRQRYFVLRDPTKWLTASRAEVLAHVAASTPADSMKY